MTESSGDLLQKNPAIDLPLVTKEAKKYPKIWFVKDCIKLKPLANRAAISKHKEPRNKNLKDYHRNTLKEFKHTCRAKQNGFWRMK